MGSGGAAMMTSGRHWGRPPSPAAWWWFGAWVLLGAVDVLALLSMLTIGVFLAPIAVIGTVLVARRPGSAQGLCGLLSGLGLPPLYVAWLNRAGPGTVCRVHAYGESCTDEMSPWPWLVFGLVVVVIGVGSFVVSNRRRTLV